MSIEIVNRNGEKVNFQPFTENEEFTEAVIVKSGAGNSIAASGSKIIKASTANSNSVFMSELLACKQAR